MEVFSWHEGLGKWIEIANVSWTQCAHAIKADVSVRCVQARNAGADGVAEGREGTRMGNESGTADDDQVSVTLCMGVECVESGAWGLGSGRGGMESERVARGLRDAGKQRPRAPG